MHAVSMCLSEARYVIGRDSGVSGWSHANAIEWGKHGAPESRPPDS
jgi:hypothetical protein